MSSYQNIIYQAIFFISYIAVFLWQYNLIKSLKSKLEVLEKFQKIFDIKALEDYVAIIKKNHEQEIYKIRTEKTQNVMSFLADNALNNLSEDLKNQYYELMAFFSTHISKLDQSTIDGILSVLPENEETIRLLLIEMNKRKV